MADIPTLAAYLRYFNIEPQMDTFLQRKKMQKLVYLMDRVGLDVGYHFSWYLYGPYSSGLTRALFEMIEQHDITPAHLTADEERRLQHLREFLGDDITSTRQLELIASLLYLRNFTNGRVSRDEIVRILGEKKPQFSEREIIACWNRLQDLRPANG
jgi:uncharacterized protein YwgA